MLVASVALNPSRIDWATLLKRTYDFDVLKCDCGGRLKASELVTLPNHRPSRERVRRIGTEILWSL